MANNWWKIFARQFCSKKIVVTRKYAWTNKLKIVDITYLFVVCIIIERKNNIELENLVYPIFNTFVNIVINIFVVTEAADESDGVPASNTSYCVSTCIKQ